MISVIYWLRMGPEGRCVTMPMNLWIKKSGEFIDLLSNYRAAS
jgi:hypothetical protein